MDRIIIATHEETGVSISDILGNSIARDAVFARRVAMLAGREGSFSGLCMGSHFNMAPSNISRIVSKARTDEKAVAASKRVLERAGIEPKE